MGPIKQQAEARVDESWEDEYGCYDVLNQGGCQFSFLNARSPEEADWMKRQGYPSRTLLAMAADRNNTVEFQALLENKYPPALTAAAILAMQNGEFDKAFLYALSARTYSNQYLSFPHRLYGEVYLNKGRKRIAATHFYIAGFLGDDQASAMIHGLARGNTILVEGSIRRAIEIMGNSFNIPLNEIPKDPRPNPYAGRG